MNNGRAFLNGRVISMLTAFAIFSGKIQVKARAYPRPPSVTLGLRGAWELIIYQSILLSVAFPAKHAIACTSKVLHLNLLVSNSHTWDIKEINPRCQEKERKKDLIGRYTQCRVHVEMQRTSLARVTLHPRVIRWNFIFNANASCRLLITPNEPSQFKRRIEQPRPFRGEARRGRSRSETPQPVPTRKFRSRFNYGPEEWRNAKTSLVRRIIWKFYFKGDHLKNQYIEQQKIYSKSIAFIMQNKLICH